MTLYVLALTLTVWVGVLSGHPGPALAAVAGLLAGGALAGARKAVTR